MVESATIAVQMNRNDRIAVDPKEFITAYECALAAQDWSRVEPLVHPDACVTFSNGTVHQGKPAVEAAFTRNFSVIKSERYAISNIRWITKTDSLAVYLFDFAWTGIIHGERASGAGRGTAVLCRDGDGDDDGWKLLVEHLGPKAE